MKRRHVGRPQKYQVSTRFFTTRKALEKLMIIASYEDLNISEVLRRATDAFIASWQEKNRM